MTKIKNFLSLLWACHFMKELQAAGKSSQVSFDSICGTYVVEWAE